VHLPKVSLKKGLYASVVCVVLAYAIWPLLYDHFGEGAELTRDAVRQSGDVRRECHDDVRRFLIVPWGLALDDNNQAGRLTIGYWFMCAGKIAKVKAEYHHRGSGWIADTIAVNLASGRYELVTSGEGHPVK